jgi:hypothetical protein
MSGQMSDVIVVDDEEFAVAEPSPGVLFDARAFGVLPVTMHSANTRGELARYRIDEDGRLLLSDLQVGSVDAPPSINGIEPTTDEHGHVWTYLQLDLSVEWSGDVIAGREPILDLYVHAGFLPVWHYERVVAFHLEAGVVLASENRSSEVADFRARRAEAEPTGDDANVFERVLDSIKLKMGLTNDS